MISQEKYNELLNNGRKMTPEHVIQYQQKSQKMYANFTLPKIWKKPANQWFIGQAQLTPNRKDKGDAVDKSNRMVRLALLSISSVLLHTR